MTIEVVISLLPYLIPATLPIIADIAGDLLPIKYVGKIRKFTQYLRTVQKNKGMQAKNRTTWNIYDGKLAAIKLMMVSSQLDDITQRLNATMGTLISSFGDLKKLDATNPEIAQEIAIALSDQDNAIGEIQRLFNETIGR